MEDSMPDFLDFDKRKNMKPSDIADMFTQAASTYENGMLGWKYEAHVHVAERVMDYYSRSTLSSVKILDVAAGTGLLAEELWGKGFRNIDGLDPSEGMKDEAMKKGVYTQYLLEFMDGTPIAGLQQDTYDCLVAVGAFNIGLLPCAALLEFVRLVKPGGLICFGITNGHLGSVEEYRDRLEPLMSWLQDDGLWELVDKTRQEWFGYRKFGYFYRYIVKTGNVDTAKYITKLSNRTY